MAPEFTARRVVEFHETDMAGIVHFANVFRWMEATEHAFFRALGTKVHTNEGGRMQGWARVHAECLGSTGSAGSAIGLTIGSHVSCSGAFSFANSQSFAINPGMPSVDATLLKYWPTIAGTYLGGACGSSMFPSGSPAAR